MMDGMLEKEFNHLQASLDSLRESVEARMEIQRRGAKEQARPVVSLPPTSGSSRKFVISRVSRVKWVEATEMYVVDWTESEGITIRPHRDSFLSRDDASRFHSQLLDRKARQT